MQCPECARKRLDSRVYYTGESTTTIAWSPFFDEAGKSHRHDPNTTTRSFQCSRGHDWIERWIPPCPNCLYPEAETDSPIHTVFPAPRVQNE